jgi:deoxycytidylate deaminase
MKSDRIMRSLLDLCMNRRAYLTKDMPFPYYIMMAAIGNNDLYIGMNDYQKTHPLSPQVFDYLIPRHAEVHAISRLLKHRRVQTDDVLYINGISKTGNPLRNTYPCTSCLSLIKEQGIRRMIYIRDGKLHEESINQCLDEAGLRSTQAVTMG